MEGMMDPFSAVILLILLYFAGKIGFKMIGKTFKVGCFLILGLPVLMILAIILKSLGI